MRIPDAIPLQGQPAAVRHARAEAVNPTPRVAKDKRDDPYRRRDYDDGAVEVTLVHAQLEPDDAGQPAAPATAPENEPSGEEGHTETARPTGQHLVDQSA